MLCIAIRQFRVSDITFQRGAKVVLLVDNIGNESIFSWLLDCREKAKRIRLLTWLQDNADNPAVFSGQVPFPRAHVELMLALDKTSKPKAKKRLYVGMQHGDDVACRLAAEHFYREIKDAVLSESADETVENCKLALRIIEKVVTKKQADYYIQEQLFFIIMSTPLVRENMQRLIQATLDWIQCMEQLQAFTKFDNDDLIPLANNYYFIGRQLVESEDRERARPYLEKAAEAIEQVTEENDVINKKRGYCYGEYADCLLRLEDGSDKPNRYFRKGIAAILKMERQTEDETHCLLLFYQKLGAHLTLRREAESERAI